MGATSNLRSGRYGLGCGWKGIVEKGWESRFSSPPPNPPWLSNVLLLDRGGVGCFLGRGKSGVNFSVRFFWSVRWKFDIVSESEVKFDLI